MARKGTAGRASEDKSDMPESGIDKVVNKTKKVLDSENEATDYKDTTDEMEEAKEHSKGISDKKTGLN